MKNIDLTIKTKYDRPDSVITYTTIYQYFQVTLLSLAQVHRAKRCYLLIYYIKLKLYLETILSFLHNPRVGQWKNVVRN